MPLALDAALVDAIADADRAIRPTVLETPVVEWPQLGARVGARVFVKREHLQRTGSFKLRGAINAARHAARTGRRIVTASSGNHGIAVSHALGALGLTGVIFLPETVAPAKLAAIHASGQEVRFFGSDSGDTEREAQRVARGEGWHYLSPYNDRDVIAGQGTIGPELLRQLERIDVVYVSVGGGGLVSGVATALKAARPEIRIVGCSPVNSCVMHESVRAGRILDLPSRPTFSDGTAGGVDDGSITLGFCQSLVDDWITVSEDEIASAVRDHIDEQHQLVEGAAGVAFAALALDAHRDRARGMACHRVAISCGANIGSARLRELLDVAAAPQR
ncbi:MAG: pyridoxal-phosphate dependent enzyme [Gemmatimonadaceae bacterium]|nr:pyridoxal-phosphate dependent enzyme [Gemmatimonadaceae bacterium]